MENEFFSRRITQSQYRGSGSSSASSAVYLDLSLSPLAIQSEPVKKGLRSKIKEQTQSMVSYLLDTGFHSQVQQSKYLNKIFTQLDL